MDESKRVVITGIGLTSPNGNSLEEFRKNLLDGVSGIDHFETRYMPPTVAGICDFDARRHQNRKDIRRGTRAGSIAVYCANEALLDAKVDMEQADRSRMGIYIGITEHGNAETENEIFNIKQHDYQTKFWTHHHNPRTVANAPAGEVSLNLKITGPAYTIGAACAGGNSGLVQGYQQLVLGDCDLAIAGGVSESPATFGIFAGFKAQGALATHETPSKASRPFDLDRNGIVISEGGALYILERLSDAQARGARIIAEIVGYAINSDASDYVLPNAERQTECMYLALKRAGMEASEIDLVSTHATATKLGDIGECGAIRNVFGECENTYINNTKSYIGHAMGGAGALELAGNIPSFWDDIVHPTINVDNLDPECALPNLVINEAKTGVKINTILNNSFGMLGINSAVIVKKWTNK
jgi:3-oxoacyl-[acyl-carrier-protein] synthase II